MRLQVLISSSIDEARPLAGGTDGWAALDGQMGAAAASRNRLHHRQCPARGAGDHRPGRGVRPWVHPVMSPNRVGGRAHEIHDTERDVHGVRGANASDGFRQEPARFCLAAANGWRVTSLYRNYTPSWVRICLFLRRKCANKTVHRSGICLARRCRVRPGATLRPVRPPPCCPRARRPANSARTETISASDLYRH